MAKLTDVIGKRFIFREVLETVSDMCSTVLSAVGILALFSVSVQ
jgi:hypothetical protein